MKVTFIHHSSFCVEIEDKAFVFDYFSGNKIQGYTFTGKLPDFEKEKQIYVFSSHQHKDHFDIEVLKWAADYPNIKYIFSKDIRLGENYLKRNQVDTLVRERIYYIKENKSMELDGIQIKTLLSTDEGVAFLVSYQDKTIYHAGDLHWWHWEEEEEAVNQYQEQTYKRQIDKLRQEKIDVAFVVIDQRLEQARYWGLDYFMRNVNAAHVIPMHLWQNYDLIRQYKTHLDDAMLAKRIVEVATENQVFAF